MPDSAYLLTNAGEYLITADDEYIVVTDASSRFPVKYAQGPAVKMPDGTVVPEYTDPDLYRTVMEPDTLNGRSYRLSVHGLNSYRLIEIPHSDDDEIP